MSDLPNHDHDPDPAALDELRRAFADPDEPVEREPHDPHDPDEPADPTVGPEPEHVAGTEPAREPAVEAHPEPEPTPPQIIRIDDYAGSAPVTDTAVAPGVVDRDADAGSVPVADTAVTPEFLAREQAGTPATAVAPDASAEHGDHHPLISISDDELPDAVYVEGSLDADGSGSIVFIEDDDTGDVLGPESERDLRRGIEPRMRERRVAVKRAQSRRRLKRLAIALGVVLLVVAVLAVLGSPLFAVREGDVQVFGVRYTDEERLAEIIDGAVGTPVLRLDTDAIEVAIEEIPWVDEATVSSDFPHGLTIDIRERAAMTTYQGPDGRFRVLDRHGRVLDVLDMYPFAYVLIGGPDAVDLAPGDFAPQGYAAASELAKNLTGSMRGRVTQIEVAADGSRLVVHLDDGSTVYFGEARDLLAKLVRLESVLANGQECESGLIDVSTADVTRCSVT